jgi:methenyltetrahydrofolate cyclohydrolase
LSHLLAEIASGAPAPASGSAAAAVVATAAALVEKSATLSAAHWPGAEVSLERAHALRLHSEELIEHDVHAYLGYVEAMRSAKGLHGSAREEVVGPARARTVDVPLDIVRSAGEVAELAARLADRGNPSLRADAVVATILAAAAAESALTLIAVNLGGSVDDKRLEEARRLARQASELALSLRPEGS